MGISPGNLYHHFRNNEEIILQADERALRAYDETWARVGRSNARWQRRWDRLYLPEPSDVG